MTKIEAIIRPEKVDMVIETLELLGHSGMTKTEVEGHGKQKGIVEQFRGKEYRLMFIPKIKIEIVVKDKDAEKVVQSIISTVFTGQIGDGKIFVSEVKDVIRVRTSERGEDAL